MGAVVGSFLMMLYASSHLGGSAGPDRTPPAVAAVPLNGVSDQDRIVSAVKRTKSSVVAIVEDINGQQYVPADPFMQQFFGQQGGGQMRSYRGQASGSGFVIDPQGDIVTNAHVVQPQQGAQITKLTAVFANGDHVPAHVVAANVGADTALIKVDGYKKLPPPLELADSTKLEAGQWAIAIGEPLELQQTVTVGVVSGFGRSEPIPTENGGVIDFKGLLQTSAPINPGNSGGPLLDIDGRVIGINQSTVKSAYAQGIGFAIPSNTVKAVVADLLKHPGIHQGTDTGFLGIFMEDLNDGVRNQIGYNGQGVAVAQVFSGSPADRAGLEPGDVILQVDGKAFDSRKSLHDYISGKKPGDTIRVNVWSQGVKKLVSVTLGETPAAQPVSQQQAQQQPEQP
ncbi:MAG TPA: trypsin-like peptidase domain-containing protein [Candidatus Tumulicola sp.]